MTELEKIEYAKSFIDKLANGINPIDDTNVPDGDIVNNVRLSRCFFYVSDILRQVIENGGITASKSTKSKKKQAFILTQEQREKISSNTISNWLVEKGFLSIVTFNGKNRKKPTEYGIKIGISTVEKNGMYGTYTMVVYNSQAQQFIYDNIDDILAFKNMDKWLWENLLLYY